MKGKKQEQPGSGIDSPEDKHRNSGASGDSGSDAGKSGTEGTSSGDPPRTKGMGDVETDPKIPLWLILILLAAVALTVLAGLTVIAVWPRSQVQVDCSWGVGPEAYLDMTLSAEGEYYPEGQVILSGSARDVKGFVRRQGAAITGPPLASCTVDLPSAPEQMSLYKLAHDVTVASIVKAANSTPAEMDVAADPNYYVGVKGADSCGNPHSIGPSPHSIGPSGSDGGAATISANSKDAAALFRNQWAFSQIGLSAVPALTAKALPQGTGVRVGVFDTSPFDPALTSAAAGQGTGFSIELSANHGVEPPWDLALKFPITPTLPAAAAPTTPTIKLGDHGLFVAGLIHAVAPESEIWLIEVLDDQGCGRLYDLNEALLQFIAEVGKDQKQGKLRGAVINLSLGVEKPRTAVKPEPKREASKTAQADSRYSVPAMEDTMDTADRAVLVKDDIESLEGAIRSAHVAGITVVAAAGNESGLGGIPLSPQLPAAYPSVIGVAGTNIERQRSCFSNWGDVSAPAGDGGPNEELKQGHDDLRDLVTNCLPVIDKCKDKAKCPDGLISLVHSVDQGYAYWGGTSFAAPLVSGLAAQVLDAGVSHSLCKTTWLPPDDVFDAVRCGVQTGDGIVNVPASTQRCLP